MIDDKTTILGRQLLNHARLPVKANADALHVALAALYRMDFLLTWNCRHIANGRTRRAIDELLKRQKMASPIIVTPEEFQYEA